MTTRDPLDEREDDKEAPEAPDGEDPLSDWESAPQDEELDDWPALPDDEGALDDEALFAEPVADEDALGEAEGLWEDAQPQASTDEDLWQNLEDEAVTLPAGRLLVGLREVASLPEQGGVEVIATMNTGVAGSVLRARYELVAPDRARLWLSGQSVELDLVEGPAAMVLVEIAGVARTLLLRLSGEDADEALALGRDALDGSFVVDVAQSFLHRGAGAVPWRM